MLTQNDIQIIKGLLEETGSDLKRELKKEFNEKLAKNKKSIINQMIKSQNIIIGHFDKHYLNHKERIERLEDHLIIPHSLPN